MTTSIICCHHDTAYIKCHSTVTVITIVHNATVRATDDGDVSALVLLNLRVAFNSVDHDVLLEVVNLRFGIEDHALA